MYTNRNPNSRAINNRSSRVYLFTRLPERHAMLLYWGCLFFSLIALLGCQNQPSYHQIEVGDIALETGFEDLSDGYFKRGRTLLAADFDLDGRIDFYVGNPGETSFILRNRSDSKGGVHFDQTQILLDGPLAWGGVAFDYDNDGDYDLFITNGGNEGKGLDYLFQNRWIEDGQLHFEDVTDKAGVAGPLPAGTETPLSVASANADVADYNRDGWPDLFVSVDIWTGRGMGGEGSASTPNPLDDPYKVNGKNILYRNNGDGTFTDVADSVGLTGLRPTRHATWIDFDNDGDPDLFESNHGSENVLWRNRTVETGAAAFEDVTTLFSPGKEDLRYPFYAFVSCAADFNLDGWEDIMVFTRTRTPEAESPYPLGYALFLNQQGKGFVNVAEQAGFNASFPERFGVMGSQIGDLTGDGVPDLYIGNGGPGSGNTDQLWLSTGLIDGIPHYQNRTDLTDFSADKPAAIPLPSYPYRTHGTAFVDVDGDGTLEIAVVNGGPADKPDRVQEPNRLFKLTFREETPRYIRIRPVGDGVHVGLDAIGTRLALTVRSKTHGPRTLHQRLVGSCCFSAQEGFYVHFLLRPDDTIETLKLQWPDGTETTRVSDLSVNSSLVVNYGEEER